jgi:hypothetical protein
VPVAFNDLHASNKSVLEMKVQRAEETEGNGVGEDMLESSVEMTRPRECVHRSHKGNTETSVGAIEGELLPPNPPEALKHLNALILEPGVTILVRMLLYELVPRGKSGILYSPS